MTILERAFGTGQATGEKWEHHLEQTFSCYDILTPKRQAGFLAQLYVESGGFMVLEENLRYSAKGLLATWPKRFTPAEAEAFAGKPEKIANRVYASRNGNGDEASGEGFRFRGRGLIQITGKGNYEACGKALGLDLVAAPEKLADPIYAALSAGWFWQSRSLSAALEAHGFQWVCYKVNGGSKAEEAEILAGHEIPRFAHRVEAYEKALQNLGA